MATTRRTLVNMNLSISKPNHSARRIVWTLTLCTALSLLGDSTLYAVLPSNFTAVGITALQVGWLLSINRLVRLPLNLVSGWLVQRFGSRAPYMAGLVLGAISTLGYGLLRGFWPLLAMRALWGAAWALIAVSAYGQVLDAVDETSRGRLVGTYVTLSYFGGALGAMLGGFLVDMIDLQRAMLILGGLSAIAWLAALSLLQHRPARPGTRSEPVESITLQVRIRVWISILRRLDARLWLILLVNFGHHFFFAGVFFATFGLYLRNVLGESVQLGSLALGVASLTATLLLVRNSITVLTGPLLGYLSDLLGDRRRVLILGLLCGVGAMVCLAFGSSLWLIVLGVLLAAVTYGVVPPMLLSWMGDLTLSGERGAIVGGYQTMGDLGSGLGPLAAYALIAICPLPTLYAICALVLGIMVLVILRTRNGSGI
ncbi:MAG: MFS transporter [Anaerolineae bacterium]